jgi:hypothetical protein
LQLLGRGTFPFRIEIEIGTGAFQRKAPDLCSPARCLAFAQPIVENRPDQAGRRDSHLAGLGEERFVHLLGQRQVQLLGRGGIHLFAPLSATR